MIIDKDLLNKIEQWFTDMSKSLKEDGWYEIDDDWLDDINDIIKGIKGCEEKNNDSIFNKNYILGYLTAVLDTLIEMCDKEDDK